MSVTVPHPCPARPGPFCSLCQLLSCLSGILTVLCPAQALSSLCWGLKGAHFPASLLYAGVTHCRQGLRAAGGSGVVPVLCQTRGQFAGGGGQCWHVSPYQRSGVGEHLRQGWGPWRNLVVVDSTLFNWSTLQEGMDSLWLFRKQKYSLRGITQVCESAAGFPMVSRTALSGSTRCSFLQLGLWFEMWSRV